jgi:hypothetical protein
VGLAAIQSGNPIGQPSTTLKLFSSRFAQPGDQWQTDHLGQPIKGDADQQPLIITAAPYGPQWMRSDYMTMNSEPTPTGAVPRAADQPGPHARRRSVLERIIHETKQFLGMAVYLWILFGLFALHESIVLAQHQINYKFYGFAVVNALILAKVMLVAEDLHLGERFREGPRILLFEKIGSAIPMPFLVVMVFWLTIIFASFGLFAPSNAIVVTVFVVCAVSVSGALFLILELDRSYEGMIQVSSAPLRLALARLSQ